MSHRGSVGDTVGLWVGRRVFVGWGVGASVGVRVGLAVVGDTVGTGVGLLVGMPVQAHSYAGLVVLLIGISRPTILIQPIAPKSECGKLWQ